MVFRSKRVSPPRTWWRPGPQILLARTISFRLPRAQPLAYDDFGMSVGLRTDINRVHLSSIKKVDAVLARMIHLRKSFFTGVLLAPGHGAKAKDGHFYICGAEFSKLHNRVRVGLRKGWQNLAQSLGRSVAPTGLG